MTNNNLDVKKYKELEENISSHCNAFLKLLFAEEHRILFENREEIAHQYYDWTCCRYGLSVVNFCSFVDSFYHIDRAIKISAKVENFKVIDNDDNGILVRRNNPKTDITIPYKYTEESLKKYFKEYFKELYETIDDTIDRNKKWNKKVKENEIKEKKLLGVHKDGKYTYSWKECEKCGGSKTVTYATGEMRMAEYMDGPNGGDINGEVEIISSKSCPNCHGTGGFVSYSDKETYASGTKPCSKWTLEQCKGNFIDLLLSL